MPYRGPPSKGCSICRTRKIKCDRSYPTCENCAKAKWTCPGYRNSIDVLFHDESEKIVRKVKTAKAKSRSSDKSALKGINPSKKDDKSYGDLNSHMKDTMTSQSADKPKGTDSESLKIPLLCPLDDIAIGYFFHHYTLGDTPAIDTCRALDSSECLKAAIMALGAAAVTNSGPGLSCSEQTELRYTEAIQLTNRALQSHLEVKKDSTLLAVNLLGIFEVKTGSQMRLESWHEHIQGATALLAYRGPKQFQTSEGGRIFMQTVSSMIIGSFCRRFEIPRYITRLVEEAEKMVPDAADWDWRCFRLSLRFAQLCARLPLNNVVRSPAEAVRIIREAWDLDQDMIDLLNDASDD